MARRAGQQRPHSPFATSPRNCPSACSASPDAPGFMRLVAFPLSCRSNSAHRLIGRFSPDTHCLQYRTTPRLPQARAPHVRIFRQIPPIADPPTILPGQIAKWPTQAGFGREATPSTRTASPIFEDRMTLWRLRRAHRGGVPAYNPMQAQGGTMRRAAHQPEGDSRIGANDSAVQRCSRRCAAPT